MTPLERSKVWKLELTMSINDPKQSPTLPQKEATGLDAWGVNEVVPPGMPDPAVLARIATEFLTSLPRISEQAKVIPSSGFPSGFPSAGKLGNQSTEVENAAPALKEVPFGTVTPT